MLLPHACKWFAMLQFYKVKVRSVLAHTIIIQSVYAVAMQLLLAATNVLPYSSTMCWETPGCTSIQLEACDTYNLSS